MKPYLLDFRRALKRDHLDRWEAGQDDAMTEAEAKGRAKTLAEIAGLQFEHIMSFYGETRADGENAEIASDEGASE